MCWLALLPMLKCTELFSVLRGLIIASITGLAARPSASLLNDDGVYMFLDLCFGLVCRMLCVSAYYWSVCVS